MMGLDDAYAAMTPKCFMAKVDIQSAFRAVSVQPDHWDLLAFTWPDETGKACFYGDKRFPFGLSRTPETFNRLSRAVRAMMARRGYKTVVVYADDFLIIAETQEECEAALNELCALLHSLGFTVSAAKTERPTQDIIFLGIRLRSNAAGNGTMIASVPPEKMHKAKTIAATLSAQQHASRKQLQKALGYFNHLAQVVYSARTRLRRLIDLVYCECDSRRIPLSKGAKADLSFWAGIAEKHNGEAVLLQAPLLSSDSFLATDASGSWGIGGYWDGDHFSIRWEDVAAETSRRLPKEARTIVTDDLLPRQEDSINYKELFAIVFAIMLWGKQLQNHHIILHTDNEAALACMNKGDSPTPRMMVLARTATEWQCLMGLRVRCVRITTNDNTLADALSRGDWPAYCNAKRSHVPRPQQRWCRREFLDAGLLLQAAALHRTEVLTEYSPSPTETATARGD
jgi:hypothetical protein